MKNIFQTYLSILIIFLSVHPMLAQFDYGIKFGYGFALTSSELQRYDDFDDYVIYNINLESQRLSPSIGAIARYSDRSSQLFLQTELIFQRIANRFRVKGDILDDLLDYTEQQWSSYLQLPVIGGLSLDNFDLAFGPALSIIIKQDVLFEELLYFSSSRTSVEASFQLRTAYKLDPFFVELMYELFFNGAADYVYHKGIKQGFSSTPQFARLNLGLFF